MKVASDKWRVTSDAARLVGRDSVEPHLERSAASATSISVTAHAGRAARYARASCVGQWGSTESHPTGLRAAPTRTPRSLSPAFTLIEIMIVVGIIAIVMTIAIPAFVSAQNKTPMRNALHDVMEACATARAQAILRGSIVELRIRPQDYTFDVAPTGVREGSGGGGGARPEPKAGEGHGVFSVKLPEEVGIEEIAVNFQLLKDAEAIAVRFHANGTSDEFTVVLRSLYNELRKVTLDPVTGRADYEVLR